MKIVYTPEGSDTPQKWDWEPGKLLVPEVIEIEKATGLTYEEWVNHMERNSAAAVRAFLWVMLKRDNARLGISSVIFTMSEISVELGDDEKRDAVLGMRYRLDNEPLDDAQVAQIEATIAQLLDDLPAGAVDDDESDAEATVPGQLVQPTDEPAPAPKAPSASE